MKKNVYLIIFFVVLVIITAGLYLVFFAQPNQPDLREPDKQDWQEMSQEERQTYSRVTFFHTGPYIASLAVPSGWEGEYRLEQGKARASFRFLDGSPDGKELFSIIHCRINECSVPSDARLLGSRENTEFYYLPAETVDSNSAFAAMLEESRTLLASFKSFPSS